MAGGVPGHFDHRENRVEHRHSLAFGESNIDAVDALAPRPVDGCAGLGTQLLHAADMVAVMVRD